MVNRTKGLLRAWSRLNVFPSAVLGMCFAAFGCTKTTECRVTDWFSTQTYRPTNILDHAFAIGRRDFTTTEKRREGTRVRHFSQDFAAVALADDSSVLLLGPELRWAVVGRDADQEVTLPAHDCSRLTVTGDGRRIVCPRCSFPGADPVSPCRRAKILEFSNLGLRNNSVDVAVPGELGPCNWDALKVLAADDGNWLFQLACSYDDVLIRVKKTGGVEVVGRANAGNGSLAWRDIRPDIPVSAPRYPPERASALCR
jgi:hypothetical protein